MADFSLSGILKLDARDFISEADRAAEAVDDVDSGLKQVDETARKSTGGLNDLGDAAGSIPGPVGDIASAFSGPGGIVAGVGAAGTAMFALANSVADTRIEAAEYATLTGQTVEDASRLLFVVKQVGVEANDLSDITLQMSDSLARSPEIAARLGVNLDDGKSAGERFVEVVGKLQTDITDATERGQIGAQLFGEEGVRQVNAIITQVGDLDQALADVSDRNVVTQDQADDALEFKEAIRELQAQFLGLAVILADGVIPAARDAVGVLAELVSLADEIGGVEVLPGLDLWSSWSDIFEEAGHRARILGDELLGIDYDPDDIGKGSKSLQEYGNQWAVIDERVRASIATSEEYVSQSEVIAEALEDQAEAFDEAEQAAADFDDEVSELLETVNDEQAWLQMQQAIEDTRGKLLNQENTLRDARLATLALKEEMIEYVATLDTIPAEKKTEILALIDEEQFNAVNARIDILTRPRKLLIDAVLNEPVPGPNVPGNVADVVYGGRASLVGPGGTTAPVLPTGIEIGAGGFANPSPTNVTVMIGQQELNDIVRVEVEKALYEKSQTR